MSQQIDWLAIGTPLALVLAGVVTLLADAFSPKSRHWLPATLSVGGLAVAMGLMSLLRDDTRTAFCRTPRLERLAPCSWVVDHVTLTWWFAIVAATLLVVLLLAPTVRAGDLPGGETYFLLLCSAAGAVSVPAAGDLITLVVALETVSLPVFALLGLRRKDRRGAEAALKFFVISVVSTAITLLGISMIYGATGSVFAGPVAISVATGAAVKPVIGVGLVLTLVGFGFKIAAVPFQAWVPDTYVGAPIPVAAYLSVVSKAAGLAGLTTVLVRFFPTDAATWTPIVAVAAALTMTVGNLAALRQTHAVRLLAWSSVAQAGYLLVPLGAGGSAYAVGAAQAYLLMYAIVNLAAFAVVLAWSETGAVVLDDFTGLFHRSRGLGLALGFALLCLAGLPPGVIGLFAKVVIFQSAVDGGATWLAVVMAVNVAIGLVYYLRWLALVLRYPSPAVPRPSSGQKVSPSGQKVPPSGQKVPPSGQKVPPSGQEVSSEWPESVVRTATSSAG